MSKPNHNSAADVGSASGGDGRRADPQGADAEQLKEEAKQAGRQAKAELSQAVDEVKEKGQQAAADAKQKAVDAVEQQLPAAAGQLDGVAKALRDTAENLDGEQRWVADGARRAAELLGSTSKSLRDQDFNGLLRSAEKQTREQPALVLGGAVMAGFLLTRFLKSSAERDHQDAPGDSARTRSVT